MTGGLGLGSALAPLGIPGTRSFLPVNTHDVVMPTQGIGISQTEALSNAYLKTLMQTVGMAASVIAGYGVIVRDDIGVTYRLIDVRAQSVTLTQGIGIASSISIVRGVVMLEQLRIALTQVANHKSQLTMAEEIGIDEVLLAGRSVMLTQGIGVALTQQASLSIQIIEELGILGVIAPMLKYGQSMGETIGIASELSRFLGAALSQGIGIAPTQISTAAKNAQLTQGVGIAHTQAPQLVLRVTATEDIGLDDINALSMLFKPVLEEGIEISAAYLSPGEGVTTWAMNTRTHGVTEYSNYDFNSFARLGDRYIGASSSGLYELLGDDDDGTDIIARIKSGFAQWAGTKFTLFKAAYLGVRGEGDFILKLIDGEGHEYIYSVSTRDMRSTKVHMGKGLRARYFAFELISSGQDFDLESIEFVPLVADRRV